MKKTYTVPPTRDPFINTPLIPAGHDPASGAERFFISTWNANVGCTCALVDTLGKSRIYRIDKANFGYAGCGAYSAYLTDPDTIWMVSEIARPLRLTLSTGEYEFFDSGAQPGLVFAGMQFDANTNKFLAISCQHERICALSFDVKKQQTAKIYRNFSAATYSHGGFPNPDGKTYTMRMSIGHSALCQWDPVAETLIERCLIDERAECFKVAYDAEGRVYLPYTGWLDTTDYSISAERMPERECCWFGRIENTVYGVTGEQTEAEILAWDLNTGKVTTLCTFPDSGHGCAALTESGEIMVVNVYGVVYQFSTKDGSLLMTKELDSTAQGRLDCLLKVNEHLILGTPYITQRFWLVDTESGDGCDAGRAAPGAGEVLQVWNLCGKVYMATYTKGVLTAFDPSKCISYPENPCVVAEPSNSMRPFAKAQDDTCLYYSSNHPYGQYGCQLTRYNAVTGQAFYKEDPVPLQEITSLLMCDGFLLGATTTAADSDCLEPKTDRCYFVRIDPTTLEVTHKTETEQGCEWAQLLGMVNEDTCLVSTRTTDKTVTTKLYSLSRDSFSDYALPEGSAFQRSAEIPGLFLLSRGNTLELWRLTETEAVYIKELAELTDVYAVHTNDDSVLLATPREIHLLDHVLSE